MTLLDEVIDLMRDAAVADIRNRAGDRFAAQRHFRRHFHRPAGSTRREFHRVSR